MNNSKALRLIGNSDIVSTVTIDFTDNLNGEIVVPADVYNQVLDMLDGVPCSVIKEPMSVLANDLETKYDRTESKLLISEMENAIQNGIPSVYESLLVYTNDLIMMMYWGNRCQLQAADLLSNHKLVLSRFKDSTGIDFHSELIKIMADPDGNGTVEPLPMESYIHLMGELFDLR